MARIGMKHLVWAPISAETPGSDVTYGTGLLLGRAISADVSFERNDNPLYADDEVAENDNGTNGYTVDVGMSELEEAPAASVLGLTAVTEGTGGNTTTAYKTSDKAAPYGGFGYIQVLRRKNITKYKAFWYYKTQFSIESESAQTKGQTIEWGTPTLHGVGMPVHTDNTGTGYFRIFEVFDTYAAAETWLNSKGNYTPPSQQTAG